MTWCEAIIAQGAPNNQILALAAVAPTSLTTRTGYGKPKITHALQLCANDNVNDCWILPAGYSDPAGIPIEASTIYGAVNGFDMEESRLASPVEVPENCALAVYAVNETAAASQTFVWLMLEYPGKGPFVEVTKSKPIVRRAWEHGAALVSLAVADSTAINTLQPGRTYQLAGIGNGAINGAKISRPTLEIAFPQDASVQFLSA
jgi:hypothetical protein